MAKLKKILIISPHFPPSNLAVVHRSRLFVQHLPAFGWDPVVLTVHEDFYEEKPDWNLVKLLMPQLRIEKVKAFKIARSRLIGDIGLRGFRQLTRRAVELVKNESIDFLYISVPSFYAALIGRSVHERTGVKYGIDYVDPWVHVFPGSEKFFSRHWLSTWLSRWLEPIAVKKASLITGVAERYYEGVLERNPHLQQTCLFGAMPYGGEVRDHEMVKQLQLMPYLFQKETPKIKLVYAGAMLPKAYLPLEEMFKAIRQWPEQFQNLEFHFIGTGKSPDDINGYNIKPLAEKYGLWRLSVFEYPARIPYLDVLIHLSASDGVFILGSTEPHYTPSKVYQAILSQKPILAVLHQDSSAVKVLSDLNAGVVLSFNGKDDLQKIYEQFPYKYDQFLAYSQGYHGINLPHDFFQKYSAHSVTKQLVSLLDHIVQ